MSDSEPNMAWIPPTNADHITAVTIEEAEFILQNTPSPVRVAIVGDAAEEACWDSQESLYRHAVQACWQGLLESVNRRGIQPVGEWVLVVAPRGYDWRTQVAPAVVAQMVADLEANRELRVLYVAQLIDSDVISSWSTGVPA